MYLKSIAFLKLNFLKFLEVLITWNNSAFSVKEKYFILRKKYKFRFQRHV